MNVGNGQSGPLVPAPTRRVTTVRNVRRIKLGVGVALAALVLAVIGALLQVGVIGAQVLRPTARGDIGEAVTFDAEARRYDLFLNRSELELLDVVEEAAGRTVCDITYADGSKGTVRGSRQVLSTDTSLGASIGYFDAVAGPTTVVCDHNISTGVLLGGYTVAESKQSLAIASLVLLGLGILAAIVASWAIASGMRGKAVMVDAPAHIGANTA